MCWSQCVVLKKQADDSRRMRSPQTTNKDQAGPVLTTIGGLYTERELLVHCNNKLNNAGNELVESAQVAQ